MKKADIKKLDKLWSEKIREKGRCEICGQTETLNAHHIVGRRNHALRWSLQNGVCLCAKHHTFAKESAHQDPEWFHDWLEENRHQDLLQLREERGMVLKRHYEDIKREIECN